MCLPLIEADSLGSGARSCGHDGDVAFQYAGRHAMRPVNSALLPPASAVL